MARSSNVESRRLQRLLKRCWTIQEVSQLFQVSRMTIHNWRATKGFPDVVITGDARPALRFVPKDVLAWAKKNNVTTHQDKPIEGKKNEVG